MYKYLYEEPENPYKAEFHVQSMPEALVKEALLIK